MFSQWTIYFWWVSVKPLPQFIFVPRFISKSGAFHSGSVFALSISVNSSCEIFDNFQNQIPESPAHIELPSCHKLAIFRNLLPTRGLFANIKLEPIFLISLLNVYSCFVVIVARQVGVRFALFKTFINRTFIFYFFHGLHLNSDDEHFQLQSIPPNLALEFSIFFVVFCWILLIQIILMTPHLHFVSPRWWWPRLSVWIGPLKKEEKADKPQEKVNTPDRKTKSAK